MARLVRWASVLGREGVEMSYLQKNDLVDIVFLAACAATLVYEIWRVWMF